MAKTKKPKYKPVVRWASRGTGSEIIGVWTSPPVFEDTSGLWIHDKFASMFFIEPKKFVLAYGESNLPAPGECIKLTIGREDG